VPHLKIVVFFQDTCVGKGLPWMEALTLMDKSGYKWSTERLHWQNRRWSSVRLFSPNTFQFYKLEIPER